MYHYQILKSTHPHGDTKLYVHAIKNMLYNKTRCFQIHVNGYNIPVEKYYTKILTWNRKTKQTTYQSVSCLQSPDTKIILYDKGSPTYHDFTVSWTHITPKDIYTESDHITIFLDDRYSYSIQSTLSVDMEQLCRNVNIIEQSK
jgi:hypothetical protein